MGSFHDGVKYFNSHIPTLLFEATAALVLWSWYIVYTNYHAWKRDDTTYKTYEVSVSFAIEFSIVFFLVFSILYIIVGLIDGYYC